MGGLKSRAESPARWLYITLVLGLLFVAGQYVAWSQLRAQGLYLATNPEQFFFLCAYRHACTACAGRAGRAALCYSQAE